MKAKDWMRNIVAFVVITLVSGICFAYSDEGFQYWSGASASVNINKDWKVTVEQELRMGDDGGNLYYEHSDLGFVYKGLADWVDLSFNYRQIYEKDGKDHWQPENRPHLNLTFKGRMFNLPVSNRSRLEFRDLDNKEDVWRYRNKIEVRFPWKFTAFELQPYLGDDVFIDLDEEDFTKNWLFSGVSFKLLENLKGEIYYMWQASKSKKEWKDVHILGTRLKFSF